MASVAPLGTPEVVPIKDVRPSPSNPRRIPKKAVEMVAKSLREFGWQQPIIVDAEGIILAGHTRHRAAALLGLKHVPVIRADGLTPEQARAFRVADNRSADFSSWDFPELTKELDALGDDFADVLGLADWDSVMSEWHSTEGREGLTDEDNELTDKGFTVHVVTFTDELTGMSHLEELFEVEGVIDVRYKR